MKKFRQKSLLACICGSLNIKQAEELTLLQSLQLHFFVKMLPKVKITASQMIGLTIVLH